MAKVNSTKDLLMLLLYAKGEKGQLCEPIRGRTRLVKMVFLFDKEVRRKFNLEHAIPESAIPDFVPYHVGPFSAQIYNDLEFLVDMGFIQVTPVGDSVPEEDVEYSYWQAGAVAESGDVGVREDEFSLTKLGREFVEDELEKSLTREQWEVLHEFKVRCTSLPLRALLRYVYTKYPNMATESKIRDEIFT